MVSVTLTLASIFLGAAVLYGAESTCLQTAIQPSERKYIKNDQGANMSIGLLEGGWPSAGLLTEMLRLLIGEALGFHVHINDQKGVNSLSPIFALAGCLNFDDPQDKRCGEAETKIHISMEVWIGSYLKEYAEFGQENPNTVPRELGSMGYVGDETIYVSQAVREAAYRDSGLALEYFASYNTSYHNPKQYFDDLLDIPTSELRPCNSSGSDFNNPQRMGLYRTHSGDYDGMDQQGSDYVARCFDNYWWAGPACRADTTKCLPIITGGNGWRLQAIMQWVTAYGFPAAVGISKSWGDFVSHGRTKRLLFYWWVPDSTFIEMQPSNLVFPRHSQSEWEQGDKKTGAKGTYLANMVSRNLASKAPEVEEFVSAMNFELAEIQDLLLKLQGSDKFNVTCGWIHEKQQKWERWIPKETNCHEGFGLISASGAFVETRAEAVGCGLCPAGRSSQEVLDNEGKTYRCEECPPGYSQPNTFSTTCEPCPAGYYTDVNGSKSCMHCQEGSYQNATASTSCIPCPSSRTTRLLAAAHAEDCVCQDKFIDIEGVCVACSTGLLCPLGSTKKDLLENVEADPSKPVVEPGFTSSQDVPIDIYKCADPTACPGGAPGTCDGARMGVTCAECPGGTFLAQGSCRTCTGFPLFMIIFGLALFLIAVVFSYYFSDTTYEGKAVVKVCILGALTISVSLLQIMAVLHTTPLPWPSATGAVFDVASVFLLDLDFMGLNCLARGNAGSYHVTAIGLLFAVLSPFLLGSLSHLGPCLKQRKLAWEKFKVVSLVTNFLQMSFTTMASFGLVPFMCYQHPMGEASLLKYPNVLCGYPAHQGMIATGVVVVIFALGFFAYSLLVVVKAPSLSGTPYLTAVYSLIYRFRPDVWWFGLVLLGRGCLVSLPAVVAANMPALLITLMLCVQQLYLCMLLWFLPWKAAILNLADSVVSAFLVVLLALCLQVTEDTTGVANLLRTLVTFLMVALLLCLFAGLMLLNVLQYFKGDQSDSRLLHIRTVSSTRELVAQLFQLSRALVKEEVSVLHSKFAKLSSYDLQTMMRTLNVLEGELKVEVGSKVMLRVSNNSQSFRTTRATRLPSLQAAQQADAQQVDAEGAEEADAQDAQQADAQVSKQPDAAEISDASHERSTDASEDGARRMELVSEEL